MIGNNPRGGGVVGKSAPSVLMLAGSVLVAVTAIALGLDVTRSVLAIILISIGWVGVLLWNKASIAFANKNPFNALYDPIDIIELSREARKGLPAPPDSPLVSPPKLMGIAPPQDVTNKPDLPPDVNSTEPPKSNADGAQA